MRLSFCDTTKPATDFVSGTPYQGFPLIGWAERFTLVGESNIVDSADFVLDSVASDSVVVYLYPDSLFNTGAGIFHLPNIFAVSIQAFARAKVAVPKGSKHTKIVVPFPHIAVPKEFFLLVISKSGFKDKIRASLDQPRTITATNARAITLGLNSSTGGLFCFPIDGNFLDTAQNKVYTNLDFGVYLESTGRVSSQSLVSTEMTIEPNPVSGSRVSLFVPGIPKASVSIYDPIGRCVWKQDGILPTQGEKFEIKTPQLENGVYIIRLLSASGRSAEGKMMIRR